MPTLEEIQGKSLIPDLPGSLKTALTGFREAKDRQRQEDIFQESIKQIDVVTDPESSAKERDAALIRFTALNPVAGNAVRQTIERADQREIDETRKTIVQGVKDALIISRAKTESEKKKILNNQIERDIGLGTSTKEGFAENMRVAALTGDEFKAAIDRRLLQGRALQDIFKPPTIKEVKIGDEIVTQEFDPVTGRTTVIGRAPAVQPGVNKPLSPEGKLQFDIKSGFVTPEQAKSGDVEVAKLNPNDFTPESWRLATSPGGSSQDLRPSELAKQKADRGEFATAGAFVVRNKDGSNSLVVPVTNKRTGETKPNVVELPGPLVERAGGQTAAEVEERVVRTAGRKTRAERMAVINTQADLTNVQRRTKRDLDNIDSAITAAEQVPVLERNLELLDKIRTGGIDAIVLATARTLGVESGDQAELTFNIRTNVLKQLKPTFGAQFTEREGRMLADIQASETKSTGGNIRLVKRAIEIYNRAINRGRRAAERQGDDAALEDIEAFLEPLEPLGDVPRGTTPQKGINKTFNPTTGLLE